MDALCSYNIFVTEHAIRKIKELSAQEERPGAILRISISGGGCSGFQYNFNMHWDDDESVSGGSDEDEDDEDDEDDEFDDNFDEEEEDEDDDDDEEEDDDEDEEYDNIADNVIKTCDGTKIIVIDKKTMQYMSGSTIDYKEDLVYCGFEIKNPNVKSGCGCGNSFAI